MELITGMGQIAQITFVGRQGDRACALFRSILIGLDLSIQFTISPRGNNADYAPDGIYCLRKKCSVCTFSHSDANTFAPQPSHTRSYASLKWFLKMAAPLSCEDCTPVRVEFGCEGGIVNLYCHQLYSHYQKQEREKHGLRIFLT